MGRRRKYPTTDNDVAADSAVEGSNSTKHPEETVMERLGFGKQICMQCNARNAPNANSCRKCGASQLREKKHAYADE